MLLLLQLVIADFQIPGHFLEILRRISLPHPLRNMGAQPHPPNTCFRCVCVCMTVCVCARARVHVHVCVRA